MLLQTKKIYMWWELHKVSPPIVQYSFSSTLEQLVELQLEQLPLWFFRVSPRTVNVDHSNSFLSALTAEVVNNDKDVHSLTSGVLT